MATTRVGNGSDGPVTGNGVTVTPAKASSSSRVAQLGARLKAAAPALPNLPTLPALPQMIRSDKNAAKKNAVQKRPAPVLPSEARMAAEKPQDLNAYATVMARGEQTAYLDLLRLIGEMRALGEKGQKALLLTLLPRLAQHELPPASLLPQLLQWVAGSDDRRLIRFVYYLIQLMLSSGSAGTPSLSPGEPVPPNISLPAEITSKAWAEVLAPETAAPVADLQLRTLAAASRASEGSQLEKQLLAAIGAALDRAESIISLGPSKDKIQRRQLMEAWDLHYSSVLATRSSLKGKGAAKIALRCSTGIISPHTNGARHALGLLRAAMLENAAGVFKADKDLAGLMRSTVSSYVTSQHVIGFDKRVPQEPRRTVNLSDKWCRLELARVCAAAVYADWTSTMDFVSGVGLPFWDMLALMATRDVEELVVLEAIRLMFGAVATPQLAPGPAANAADAKAVKLRMRAWMFLALKADKPVGAEQDAVALNSSSLCDALGSRLQKLLQPSVAEPLLCSACHTAGVILETAARANVRGGRSSKESKALQMFVKDIAGMVTTVQTSCKSLAVQYAALEALLWTQVGNKEASVSGVAIAQLLRGGYWQASWVRSLLERVFQVMRVAPASAAHMLEAAGAIASAAASSIEPEQLTDLWTMAMKLPNGKPAALSSALDLLASPPPSRSTSKGASAKALARAAADEAGYLELQRNAAWWLGENANLACNEFAGSLAPEADFNENEAPAGTTSPLETAALEALRNPGLAAVVSHLQHAALTQPPAPKTAAVQAITKIAVRSEEPYRLQCYSFLATLSNTHQASAPDSHGVACIVQPVLPILDSLYSSRLVLEGLAQTYGRIPQRWPPAVVAQLRLRHNLLEQRIQRVICSLSSASYFILGPLSRDLLNSGVESLAPQKLPVLHTLRTARSVSSDTSSISQSQSQPTRQFSTHSRKQSMSEPSFLGGPDPLAALTDNLNQHITAEAFKPRAPPPWETNTFQPPVPIPEEASSNENEYANGDPLEDMLRGESSQNHAEEAPEYSAAFVPTMSERGTAIHTFEAEMSDELTVRTGEQVEVQAEVDGWLHCENQYGIRGLVPATYIRILSADEGPGDALSQLFGGYSQPGHQREKSVDLLNQPDMLSAFLSPPPAAEDDWGTQTYHGRSSSRTYDFDEPAYLPDNVEGEMAIPEPQPYIEPEPIQQYDSYGSSPSKDAYVDTDGNGYDYAAPIASDNPFLAPSAADNPFEDSPTYAAATFSQGITDSATIVPEEPVVFESQVRVQMTGNPGASANSALPDSVQFESQPSNALTSIAEPQPIAPQGSVLFESQPSIPYEQPPGVQIEFESARPSLDQQPGRAESVAYETALPPVQESNLPAAAFTRLGSATMTMERSPTLAKRESLPRVSTARQGAHRLERADTGSIQEPSSARIEYGSDVSATSPLHDAFRSREYNGPAAAQVTPPTVASQTPTSASTLDHRRSHSRSISRDFSSLSRKFSIGDSGPNAHRRRSSLSRTSFDLGASPISRQASVDTGLTSIKGQVLYGFSAESEDELTVTPGEPIVIQAEMEGWYQVLRLSDGKRGLIPASYAKAL